MSIKLKVSLIAATALFPYIEFLVRGGESIILPEQPAETTETICVVNLITSQQECYEIVYE